MLQGVVKTFRSPAGTFTALQGIDMTIGAGEYVAVVGKSGSGKTTLMNMITGIDRPTSGEVWVGGMEISRMREGKLATWRGSTIGVVFQFFQLIPTLTLVENVMLPMDFCHKYRLRQRKERAMDLLAQVDLSDCANKLPLAVSGGQQQRAAIARALANDPPILTADEPTGNLDSVTAESVYRLFERLVKQGKSVIMVTHDAELAGRSSRTIHLIDGKIVPSMERIASSVLSAQGEVPVGQEILSGSMQPG
jgi:putative ABC transport system ATP-binding protein